LACRKNILPCKGFACAGIFSFERIGKINTTEALSQIDFMNGLHSGDLAFERLNKQIRQKGDAIFSAFAISDDDLAVGEVYIFDAQAEAFHQSEASAIQEACHKPFPTTEVTKNGVRFIFSKDDGQALGFFCSFDVVKPGKLDIKEIAV